MMPDELALELGHLNVYVVQLTDDLRAPVVIELFELLLQVYSAHRLLAFGGDTTTGALPIEARLWHNMVTPSADGTSARIARFTPYDDNPRR